MNWFSSVFNWFRGNSTSQASGKQATVPSASAYDETPNVGPDSALQVSTVWRCVELLSEMIASLPLFVFMTDNNGQRQIARDEVLYQILHDSPNRRQTSMEFWLVMMMSFFLRGNAYARIQRNSIGEAIALWPLSPDQMEVSALPDGSRVYAYIVDNTPFIYHESEILHIHGMGNGIVGLSRLDYMRSSIGLAISTQNHTAKTYNKNARRPGILMSDNVLTPTQREAIRASFGDIISGGQKELFILEANFKFEPLGMTPADLQLLETRRFAVEDHGRWFGVPSVMINDNSSTTTWGSGVAEIVEGFYKFTVRPKLELIEQAISKRVLTPAQRARGLQVEFNFDALLRASLADRMEIYAKATQNGIYTRNECRQLENSPPMPGGNVLTAQSNLVPIDMLGKVQGGGNAGSQDPIAQ